MAKTTVKQPRPHPIVLAIIEGFGIAMAGEANAISAAETPFFDHIINHYPTGLLEASGEAIGLEGGMSSSSRIGHYVIGHGRAWPKTSRLISESLADGSYRKLKGVQKLEETLSVGPKRLHLIGLISSADTETKLEHLKAMLAAVNLDGVEEILIHGILDGRKTSATAGQRLLKEVSEMITHYKKVSIVSVMGRLYGLDNKHNSARTQKALSMLLDGEANKASSLEKALKETYAKKIYDEEFPPTVFTDNKNFCINKNDVVLFWNYRGSSLVSLAEGLVTRFPKLHIFTMTNYGLGDKAVSLFEFSEKVDSLGSVLADNDFKQLRLGDSAGFFGPAFWLDDIDNPIYKNVERRLIPINPQEDFEHASLDAMSELKRNCLDAVASSEYDFIAVSFSQIDLTAHQGDFEQTKRIVEELDLSLKAIAEAVEVAGGALLITSTHGSAERMIDPATGASFKKHSLNPVFLSLIGRRFQGYNLGWPEISPNHIEKAAPIGNLADIAPTILKLMGLKKPSSMTGNNLGA